LQEVATRVLNNLDRISMNNYPRRLRLGCWNLGTETWQALSVDKFLRGYLPAFIRIIVNVHTA
jgi:hypothetical protein